MLDAEHPPMLLVEIEDGDRNVFTALRNYQNTELHYSMTIALFERQFGEIIPWKTSSKLIRVVLLNQLY